MSSNYKLASFIIVSERGTEEILNTTSAASTKLVRIDVRKLEEGSCIKY
jgi:hypothetical protein